MTGQMVFMMDMCCMGFSHWGFNFGILYCHNRNLGLHHNLYVFTVSVLEFSEELVDFYNEEPFLKKINYENNGGLKFASGFFYRTSGFRDLTQGGGLL